MAAIDTEKVSALLWKTEAGKIVRKRLVNITLKNTEDAIEMVSKVNLAESDEAIYDPDSEKTSSWSLLDLETFVYECPEVALPDISDLWIEFRDDTISFTSTSATPLPNHIVLLMTHANTAHEIHIDRRTGLTYEIKWKPKDASGWHVTCN